MKILVPVKRVVDYNIKIRLRSDGSGVEICQRQDVDETVRRASAVEEAVRLGASRHREP